MFALINVFTLLLVILYWTYYIVTISNEEIDDIEEGKIDFIE